MRLHTGIWRARSRVASHWARASSLAAEIFVWVPQPQIISSSARAQSPASGQIFTHEKHWAVAGVSGITGSVFAGSGLETAFNSPRAATSIRGSSGASSAGVGGGSGAGFSTTSSGRSEEHTSELQSRPHLVCRLLLEKKKQHRKPLSHALKKMVIWYDTSW